MLPIWQALTPAQQTDWLTKASPQARDVLRRDLITEARTLAARSHPSPYALASRITGGTELQAPHLELLDRLWQRIDRGEVVRAIVSMPPRHGKTVRLSRRGPAWFLNRNPDKRVLLASYESDFAATHGRAVRDSIIEHPEAFAIRINQASSAANRWDILGHTGGMFTVGVGGALTGRGADVLVCDDPVKNAEEAMSETYRERAWDWWRTTAYTRLEPGGSSLVIMTRWHEDDLAGKLLQHEPERWEYVRLPAIADTGDPLGRAPGEALWPDRYPANVLHATRDTLGAFWFSALYQGVPAPVAGGLFKREWIHRWTMPGHVEDVIELDDGRRYQEADCTRFCTVDLAASLRTEADMSVCSTWDLTPDNDLIWRDCEMVRLEGPDQIDMLHRANVRWRPAFIAVESVGYQLTFIQAASRAGLPIRKLEARGDKVARALTASTRYSLGKIFHPVQASWLDVAETQLLTFPKAAHDDVVDTVSYAAIQIAQVPERRKLRFRP